MLSSYDWMKLIALCCLARASYEATKPGESKATIDSGGCSRKLTVSENDANLRPSGPDLPPQVEEWKSKELQRFREAQERKWHNWARSLSR